MGRVELLASVASTPVGAGGVDRTLQPTYLAVAAGN